LGDHGSSQNQHWRLHGFQALQRELLGGSDAATPPRRQAEAEKGGTYFSMGVTPIAVWIVDFMKNPKIKWMMTGGTSPQFLGNFHI